MDSRSQLADLPNLWSRACADLAFSWRLAPTLLAMQLRARRRSHLLGFAWIVLPIATSLALALLLQSHRIVRLPQLGVSYAVFVVTGVALWQSFVEALNLPLQQLVANRHGLSRLALPLEAPILSGALELAMVALIRALLLVATLAFLGVRPGGSLLLLPAALLGLAAFGLTLGMIAAPVGMLVGDVGRGLLLFSGIWMLASPVLYPTGGIRLGWLNPVAPLIDAARGALCGMRIPAAAWPIAVASLIALLPAWLYMRLARRYFIEPLA